MLNPRRLVVFRELAERGSFTAAADALSYTQSAISQQISALEREAGAILIERDRKRTRLTEAGEILLAHTDAILGRIAHAEQELSAYVEARSGRLRLAAFESAGAALVPAAVESFHERHPGVELNVVQMEPAEAATRLENRELDLALLYDLQPPTSALGDELELTYLFDDPYVSVISSGHRLARERAVDRCRVADCDRAEERGQPTQRLPRDVARRNPIRRHGSAVGVDVVVVVSAQADEGAVLFVHPVIELEVRCLEGERLREGAI